MFTGRVLVEMGRALRNRGVPTHSSRCARAVARASFRDGSMKLAALVHDAGAATFAAVESLATDDVIEAADVIGVCLTAERFDAICCVVASVLSDRRISDEDLSFASDIAGEVRAIREACERVIAPRLGQIRSLVEGHDAPESVSLADWGTEPCEWWVSVFRKPSGGLKVGGATSVEVAP